QRDDQDALDGGVGRRKDADMRFTVERMALVKMIEHLKPIRGAGKKRENDVLLTVCGPMVFVEANSVTGGCEALVMEEGTCRLMREGFLAVLKSFAPKKNLRFVSEGDWLRVERFEVRMRDYSPHAVAPEGYKPFPVAANWLEIPGASEDGAGAAPRA
ncbi:MAG: hypothetical protein EBS05_25400, partial [Proteobacteria bacterium]|nr:hypothetical protein [Pseudomonadota bacterium]